MSLINTYRAVRDEEFRQRVIAAMGLTAQDIVADPTIPNYELRYITAVDVLRNPDNLAIAISFVWRALTSTEINETVTEESKVTATDDMIIEFVRSTWPKLYPLSTE